MNAPVSLDLNQEIKLGAGIHRWFARRGPIAARTAVAVTARPEIVADPSALECLLDPGLGNAASLLLDSADEKKPWALLDLCAGTGSLSEAALALGMVPTAVDLHPIPVLISRCTFVYPARYGSRDPHRRGCATDGLWAGLSEEVSYWSSSLIEDVRKTVGQLWLKGLRAVICARVARCPNPVCRAQGALDLQAAGSGRLSSTHSIPYARGGCSCPTCGMSFSVALSTLHETVPLTCVAEGQLNDVEPQSILKLLGNVTYPATVADRLDQAWAINRSGPIPLRVALTPRQATLHDALRRAVRRAREGMADAGYSPSRIVALSTYLALAASDQLDYLCTGTTWNATRRQVNPALQRAAWTLAPEFAEAGGTTLDRQWARRVQAMKSVIDANSHLPVSASVMSADMTNLPMHDASFDLVVWDPPYYDNVDYDLVAAPWTHFLRSVIGELDIGLHWPSVYPTAESVLRERFDPEAYEQSLAKSANEIVRVSRTGGRVGVFWISRSPDDLQRFVDLVQPGGLELIQTAKLRTERTTVHSASTGEGTLLVFRVVRTAPRPIGSPVEAAQLLELASSDQPSLNAGLAEVLLRAWGEEEALRLVPADITGAPRQRLVEYVATVPDPVEMLRDLGRKALLQEAQGLGANARDLADLDTLALARRVLRHLGFSVPSPPSFSLADALAEASRSHTRVSLATSYEELTGVGMAACQMIERILRFSVVSWASHARRDEWETLLEELAAKRTYPGADHLSFGDWVQLFVTIPQHLIAVAPLYEFVHRHMKARKIGASLPQLVGDRNWLAHPKPTATWAVMQARLDKHLGESLEKLKSLINDRALPLLLQPVEEIRDRYSRYRLRLVDHDGRDVEMLVAGPSDLTAAKVWLWSSTKPRDVNPALLEADTIGERAAWHRTSN